MTSITTGTEPDRRYATTLGEAAQNPDGTFNGLRGLAWLSEILNPGHGIPEAEVKRIAEEVIATRRKGKQS